MDLTLPISLARPVAFLDLETTGLNRSEDRIVELALLILYPDGRVVDRVRRFNPGIPIPAEASAVHGIGDADVAGEEPSTAGHAAWPACSKGAIWPGSTSAASTCTSCSRSSGAPGFPSTSRTDGSSTPN